MIRSLFLLLAGLGVGSAPGTRPRLVVVITVDQLRPDYLDRYRPTPRGPFATLLQGRPFRAAGTLWTLFLSERDYPEPDSASYENQGRDIVFPHRLPTDSGQAALAFIGTPTMDSLTLAFALEGVRAMQLGGRGATDLLAVSLSTTDYVGHAYGPDSREIHDQVVRLDRYLERFLEQLFVRYGRNNVLVVLTADHGVTPFPERSRALGHPGAVRGIPATIFQRVNAAPAQRAGGGRWPQHESGMR